MTVKKIYTIIFFKIRNRKAICKLADSIFEVFFITVLTILHQEFKNFWLKLLSAVLSSVANVVERVGFVAENRRLKSRLDTEDGNLNNEEEFLTGLEESVEFWRDVFAATARIVK